jgi:hypothetical protein
MTKKVSNYVGLLAFGWRGNALCGGRAPRVDAAFLSLASECLSHT